MSGNDGSTVEVSRVEDHEGFHTNSDEDLHELLQRAENYAGEALGFPGMAAEFAEAADYVNEGVLGDG